MVESREGPAGCDWSWHSTYVTSRGKVQPCCMVMGIDRAVMGELLDGDLATAWADEPCIGLQSPLLSADDPTAGCRARSACRGRF